MTRKDYELIANVLNEQYHAIDTEQNRVVVVQIVARLGRVLQADNARFDTKRFQDAVAR